MRSMDLIITQMQEWLYNDTSDPRIVEVERDEIEEVIKDLHLHEAQRDEMFAAMREQAEVRDWDRHG